MAKRTTNRRYDKGPRIEQLFNGDFVKVRGVSPALLDQVQTSVDDPEIPIITTDDGSELENPNDPAYHRALKAAAEKRDKRVMYAVISFGMTLCDEEGNEIDPPDDGWEMRLKKIGIDWQKEIQNITGPIENEEELAQAKREAYLYLIAVSGPDYPMVMSLAGAPEQAQREAEGMFQRSETRNTDS